METKRPTQLAIDGKVISIEKIGEKSLAQFAAQLKQNGIVLEQERLERVYTHCRGEKTAEEQAIEAQAKAKAEQAKAQAKAQAEQAKAAALARIEK